MTTPAIPMRQSAPNSGMWKSAACATAPTIAAPTGATAFTKTASTARFASARPSDWGGADGKLSLHRPGAAPALSSASPRLPLSALHGLSGPGRAGHDLRGTLAVVASPLGAGALLPGRPPGRSG